MSTPNPVSLALDALSRAGGRAWRPAVVPMLRDGLTQWPGDPNLVDAMCRLADNDEYVASEGESLVELLVEGAHTLGRRPSAPLLVHAARVSWVLGDGKAAWRHLVDALSWNPSLSSARELLVDFQAEPSVASGLEDGMEGLALRAVRGDVDRSAVVEIFDSCVSTSRLVRARALLGV